MKSLFLLLVMEAGAALAQSNAPTYGDVVAARRAGLSDPRAAVAAPRCTILHETSSNVVVQITDVTGGVRTATMRKVVMPGSDLVASNATARMRYFAQRDRLLMALAQSAGDDARVLTGRCVTADDYLAAAYVSSNHADRICSGQDTLNSMSITGASGWAAAAGLAGAALASAWTRRKRS